ncbi:hypothetical protein GCM10022236_02440 [Microlunatus ginsengisoli]|uniref:Uncharacterized protein n=1 Tax=Microlunatus ginsengisoli TaxID=363863 RepID=A0ABP6ZB54_9ACTN
MRGDGTGSAVHDVADHGGADAGKPGDVGTGDDLRGWAVGHQVTGPGGRRAIIGAAFRVERAAVADRWGIRLPEARHALYSCHGTGAIAALNIRFTW